MSKRCHIGLTGIMGSGKSSAAGIFERLGFRRIDSDAVVRHLLQEDAAVRDAIRGHFGSGLFRADGSVDRALLAQQVFTDAAALNALESILHPRVREHWTQALNHGADDDWCVEIPLLFEKKLEIHFDCSVCVSAGEDVCATRLAAKGFTAEDARARMARQLPLDEKIRRADYVLSNNGSLEFLNTQIQYFLQMLKA